MATAGACTDSAVALHQRLVRLDELLFDVGAAYFTAVHARERISRRRDASPVGRW